jgi:hypothetical protein
MASNLPLFIFLAAAAVAGFAFLSLVVWVHGQTSERKTRDRLALLRALAENPGENARAILAHLQAEDEARRARKEEEDRRGHLMAAAIMAAVGLGLFVMSPTTPGPSVMMLLIGGALLLFAPQRKSSGKKPS